MYKDNYTYKRHYDYNRSRGIIFLARKKVCGIYKILNKINGKFYIGSSNNIFDRFVHHKYKLNNNKHENEHLQAAWNKYGEHNFELQVLEEVEEENLLSRENYYIQTLNCINRKIGYNKSDDAIRQTMSEEGKERVRQWHRNKIVKESTRKKLSLINKGVPKWTEKQKQQMSVSRKGINEGKDNPMFGRKRELNGMFGKHLSDKVKQQISEMKKGITKEQNPNLTNKPKRCICTETGEIYESIAEASKSTGIPTKSISYCLSGKRAVASGLHFKIYKERENENNITNVISRFL